LNRDAATVKIKPFHLSLHPLTSSYCGFLFVPATILPQKKHRAREKDQTALTPTLPKALYELTVLSTLGRCVPLISREINQSPAFTCAIRPRAASGIDKIRRQSRALKRPASAVRFRPWPPSFNSLRVGHHPKYVPIRSKNPIACRGLSCFCEHNLSRFSITTCVSGPVEGYQLAPKCSRHARFGRNQSGQLETVEYHSHII